ncbi:MAG: tripartite tricarboxylate transporter substrate binding protein [Burkholderiaceae bacterium]
MKENLLKLLSATLLGLAALPVVAAQPWMPNRPVQIILPYTAGGTSDIVSRGMAERLQERFRESFIVDYRPGGATQIGSNLVAKSKPDGHTILFAANTFMINPSLFKQLPYDTLKDFEPITYAGLTPHTLVVSPNLPINTLQELVDYSKTHPGKLAYGSVGNGTSFHLGTEELKKVSGLDAVHVPYKGMSQVLSDVMGNNIDFALANTPSVVPLVQSGKLRAIAIAHPTRIAQLPDVPTVSEQGYPGYASSSAFLYLVAGGTPVEILDRLNEEFVAVLREPSVQKLFSEQGIEVKGTTRAETAEFIRVEMEKAAELVKFTGAKVD